ncbi:hypothetical protein [Deinococcus altitudinis]|uniref:hypothetical protein n=1 Tax=Deinococcus altitudinis TaxID=468914 RepID=UPI00389271AC
MGAIALLRPLTDAGAEIARIGKAWVFPADLRVPLSEAVKAVFGDPLAEPIAPRHVSVTIRVTADLVVAPGSLVVAGYGPRLGHRA